MKFNYALVVIITCMVTQNIYAQYNQDALRFSRFDRGSTSRIKGIGNASTAIGGDLSSISTNPAGLGFFNGSEFSFTPEYNFSDISSTYFNQKESDKKKQANFNNASVVFHSAQRIPKGADPTKGLLSVNFGLSWNRTNNFYDNIYYAGFNPNNSIADMFAERAYDDGPTIDALKKADSPLGFWGYEHFLVDTIGHDASGLLYAPVTHLNSSQSMTQVTTGGQNEFNLAVGANYSNKLYVGMSLAFTNLKYNSTSTFAEEGNADFVDANNVQRVRGYKTFFDNQQTTTGNGFNLKLGFIYKPVESVQFGASFTSPTWYSVEDNTTLGLETFYTNGDKYPIGNQNEDESFEQNYNLRTPLKVSGGLAVFIEKKGFITADLEYVDYAGMHMSGYDGAAQDNKNIKELYQSTVNARIGAEGRITPNVYLRAGYGYLGNPEKGIGGATTNISGGIGYRISNFFVDATYTNVSRKQNVYPYEVYGSTSPEAELKRSYNNAYLTVGFRF
ncbi:OmpP1/FadL family transporter [Arcticibacter tournemirensis]|uniref:Aromatic hydrocarbon degradation protein n=1 Tax=Arcticibacter tournemirensis TaxID=699437 RepID=A0A4Q0MB08_9SPHI|nr:hypothetical protein [Arcticibacter tournemirensis]RXF70468.1 hypothetical protein EKH83_07425 [Arcticibacter tournemirensis]